MPTQSYHLPDLLGIISSIPLRTNSHCKPASESSQNRILDSGLISTREAELIHPAKVGLLVALCFPTCDRPQLTLLSEAGIWLLVSAIRSTEQNNQVDLWPGLNDQANIEQLDGLDMLKQHELLEHILHDGRISRLASLDRASWEDRFTRTLVLYYNAQHTARHCGLDGRIPTLDGYLSVCREMFGTGIMFDLAELLEIFPFPEFVDGTEREKLKEMRECAFNIIAWSFDIGSYHTTASPYYLNLITILMTHDHLSIQGAMNLAGSMIKDAFCSFCALEKEIIESMEPAKSMFCSLSSVFDWKKPNANDESIKVNTTLADLKRYMQGLKDCIAGSMHWLYETELFFGKKGGEVRSFGWVFADMKYIDSGTLEPAMGGISGQ